MPRPSWKSPRAVVPPRVHPRCVGVQPAEHVDEAPLVQRAEPVALGLADVGLADELRRVVHVDVGRGDVEVAGHDHGIARLR